MPIDSDKAVLVLEYDGSNLKANINRKSAPHILGGLLYVLDKPEILEQILIKVKEQFTEEDMKTTIATFMECKKYDDLMSENDEDWMTPIVPNNMQNIQNLGEEDDDDDET